MKKLLVTAFLFLALPLYAEWSDYGLALMATGPSSLEGAVKYALKDAGGRTFYINAPGEPARPIMKRMLKRKDDFYAWKHASVKELSFFVYEKGVHAVLVPEKITYKDTDLKKYLPAGFTFVDDKGTLNYRYRVIVKDTSLKLDGDYTGEEPMIGEMYAYIKGIREGKIIVEDEKVVSGSVVSLSNEKKMGERQVHPVGDLPFYDKETGKTGLIGTLQFYASVQGSYLYPVSFLGDIFIGGYGFTAAVGICDLGFSLLGRTLFRFNIELMTGFWNLNERKQQDDYDDCAIKNAYVIPVGVTARYPIGIMKDLYLSPSLGFGYYYNKLEYNKLYPNGTVECVSVREWNPALTVGLRCDYRFKKFCIFAGPDFLIMFERRLDLTTLLFNAGCTYLF